MADARTAAPSPTPRCAPSSTPRRPAPSSATSCASSRDRSPTPVVFQEMAAPVAGRRRPAWPIAPGSQDLAADVSVVFAMT